ncbi:hypothetical protein OH77DRAFT_756788 [Trametes cingulata]|nr:hypothetical protein OH77DRAFT_756788 [Trametes cingulata]
MTNTAQVVGASVHGLRSRRTLDSSLPPPSREAPMPLTGRLWPTSHSSARTSRVAARLRPRYTLRPGT